jgi:multidrug efflux pump subunit AcrB
MSSGLTSNGSRSLPVWAMDHPVGVVMLALAVVVLGASAALRLPLDLLPHIIYPDIRVRVMDPGVPASVMEDRITRQLEEQLAITEGAVAVESTTTEGRSAVDLSFAYGEDIDRALRDASTRLDRARRFLPTSVDPPIIYKRDPSQRPVMQLVIGSSRLSPVALRDWVDQSFAKWFLNIPGVAAAEVGGGMVREVHVLPDLERLAAVGLGMDDLVEALREGNRDTPSGRLEMPSRRISSRTAGRFESLDAIAALPLVLPAGGTVSLGDVAEVRNAHEDEALRIRANGVPGVKVSIQKQPTANTVDVVDRVRAQLAWLRSQRQLPDGIEVAIVGDQSRYIRYSLRNATTAALGGGLLAMLVVYLFLGNLRRTLIIGTAIPLAILVTFVLMVLGGLTLNIMTLGGLALGIGLLVDNTIVMMENIVRHQHRGGSPQQAATEVSSAIVAATTTNLAAVLPFLFIGGLVGLLFRELIATISAAILASLLVALTLVPALAARVPPGTPGRLRRAGDRLMDALERGYAWVLAQLLRVAWLWPLLFAIGLWFASQAFFSGRESFLPPIDDGSVRISLHADPGVRLPEMDRTVRRVEAWLHERGEVAQVTVEVGGFVYGRSAFEAGNRASLMVELAPRGQRSQSNKEWVTEASSALKPLLPAGVRLRMRTGRVPGIRVGRGEDDLSVRLQGPDRERLTDLGRQLLGRLRAVPGLGNLEYSAEEVEQELTVVVDRERAAALGVSVEEVGQALRHALQGEVITEFMQGGRSYDLRLRLPRERVNGLDDLGSILLGNDRGDILRVDDVARIRRVPAPASILRDRQQRMVEGTASLDEGVSLGEAHRRVTEVLRAMDLPSGYSGYTGGSGQALREGRGTAGRLLALALFLVFVVMAVQYESLRNPLVILVSVPFAAIGVAWGMQVTGTTPSMPVWLGMIMLAGIVVNNAILLVEQIENLRSRGEPAESVESVDHAITAAAASRLRPILMTTITTVCGLLPLAMGIGDGAEMLQPLAVTISWGLSFSVLVSLVLVPSVYRLVVR